MMQRRQFLRGALSLGAAALLPGVAVSANIGGVPAKWIAEPLMPIWEAAYRGRWHIVQEWLRRDPSLATVTGKAKYWFGEVAETSLLHLAVARRIDSGWKALVFVFLGIYVCPKDDSNIMLRSVPNDVAVLKDLISAGADVNAKDGRGKTPLHHAVGWGLGFLGLDVPILEYLISVGADVHARDEDGMTPLDRAKNMGKTEIEEYLTGIGTKKSRRSRRT